MTPPPARRPRRSRARGPLALLVAALVAACAPTGTAHRDADPVRLTLLQINDVYQLEPVDGGRRGGLARVATLVREIRRESPFTVFVLAGDALSPSVASTFLRGEQMVAALGASGLDLATLGGIRVGFLGLTTASTAATSSPGPDVAFADPLAAGPRAAAALRARGAQLVVAVTHQDMADDKALARAADVDVILGGHEHDPLVAEEGRALITKAGSDARYLVQVDLWLTPAGRLVERSFAFREVSARVAADPGVAELVRAYALRLDRALDVVVGATATPLEARGSRLRTEETNLGDFVADAVRERMGTQVALVNGGGIRTNRTIAAGPLSRRIVHGLLPFTNVVVALELAGRELREALEHGLAQADREGGGFLQISGLRLVWDPARAAGRRIVTAEVGGAPLADGARDTVAGPALLYRGGDGFRGFSRARVLVGEESGPQLTQIVLDAIVRRGTIAPEVDGRLVRRRR